MTKLLESAMESSSNPVDAETIRRDSLEAGGPDPTRLRFRVVEYERATGDFIGVLLENSGFLEAVENTHRFIAASAGSHFCLEPLGYLQ